MLLFFSENYILNAVEHLCQNCYGWLDSLGHIEYKTVVRVPQHVLEVALGVCVADGLMTHPDPTQHPLLIISQQAKQITLIGHSKKRTAT